MELKKSRSRMMNGKRLLVQFFFQKKPLDLKECASKFSPPRKREFKLF